VLGVLDGVGLGDPTGQEAGLAVDCFGLAEEAAFAVAAVSVAVVVPWGAGVAVGLPLPPLLPGDGAQPVAAPEAPGAAWAEAVGEPAWPLAPEPEGPVPRPPGPDACVPWPSVPPPDCVGECPSKTLELAWMIASRTGWTPNDSPAMTAIPPRTQATRRRP
jgi:hypothetical protein